MKHLTYATVCSGIECMSAACADLPMKPVFFSEIEPFPCAVLKSHFPDVPNLGDMSQIKVSNDGKEITNGSVRVVLDARLDIFAGGTPCQDVSVAGKRSGMQEGSGTRSSLAFEFVRLVRELKPRYVLWENVAGVLSDRSFPEFLTALAECGYGVAYRTLDAQWIRCADIHHADGRMVSLERAIPQRRRRVWIVGCAGGNVTRSAEILFEHQGVVGDSAPCRRTGQEIARASQDRNQVYDRLVGESPGNGAINTFCETGHGYWMPHPYAETIRAEGENRPSRPCNVAVESQCIALDGDKLKPRENPRKDCIHDHQAIMKCRAVENHPNDSRVKLSKDDVCQTISSRCGTEGGNEPMVVLNKISHAHYPAKEVLDMQGGKIGAHYTEDDSAPTLTRGRGSANDIHAVTMVSTNSNGGDVMPSINANASKLGGDNQTIMGGGYIIHELRDVRHGGGCECEHLREEGAGLYGDNENRYGGKVK